MMAKKAKKKSKQASRLGRPKPSSPKTGVHPGKRYDDGGKIK